MKDQLKIIRENAKHLAHDSQPEHLRHSGRNIMDALTQLEAMVGWHVSKDGLPPIGSEVIGGHFYKDTWLKGEPEVFAWGRCRVIPTDDPEFPDGKRWLTFGPSHNQITHWRAAPMPPGSVPVAQQPQARPDFTDEWTGYLKDGETPFERFMRERKDLTALAKLYQRALEENERLKAQQPQAEAVPSDVARDADVEAAAKKMAEIFDYPWDFMPEKGRNTMRENVRAVLTAAQGAKT